MVNKFLISFFANFFLLATFSNAQSRQQVTYGFEKDSIALSVGESFSNKLIVRNNTSKKVVLKENNQRLKLQTGLISLPDSIVLNAAEVRSFPLKYMVDKNTIKQTVQAFTVFLSSSDNTIDVQPSASFITKINGTNNITLTLAQTQVYLPETANHTQVIVYCNNPGLVPVSFRLVAQARTADLVLNATKDVVTVEPSSTQAITVDINKTGRASRLNDDNISVTAMDINGKTIAFLTVRIINVGSNKRFNISGDELSNNFSNTWGLRYQQFSALSSLYELWGNGKLSVNKNALYYNFAVDVYGRQQGVGVYNTNIDYKTKTWGIKAGNVSEILDFSLNGRGLIASAYLRNNKTISVYAVQNQYMLVNTLYKSFPAPVALAADYSVFNTARDNYHISLIKNSYSYFGLSQYQVSGTLNKPLSPNETITIEGGTSNERTAAGNNENNFAMAIGVNYLLNNKHYNITSFNYYSMPHYTGLRRGLTQSQTRFTWRVNKAYSLLAMVSIFKSNPADQFQTIDTILRDLKKNDINIYQIGYNAHVGHLSFGMSPYLMQQKLSVSEAYVKPGGNSVWQSSAIKMATTLGYQTKKNSYFMQADLGYVFSDNSGRTNAPYPSARINTAWVGTLIGFNGYMQVNPFYLSDNLSLTGNSKYYQLSAGPNFHITKLIKGFYLQGNVMYNHYSFSQSNNFSVTANAGLELKNNWTITGDFFSADVRQYYTNNTEPSLQPVYNRYFTSQFRVGIQKKFGRAGIKGSGKLELSFYHDINANGIKDPGEPAAQGAFISVNGEVAQTDKNGRVRFSNLPEDNYTIQVNNATGWNMPQPISMVVKGSKKAELPLVKTIPLKGTLMAEVGKYEGASLVLSGVNIVAVSPNGKTYQTLTDDQGQFSFFLPPDKYTIQINTAGLPFSVKEPAVNVDLALNSDATVVFKRKDERRKVNITRF